jgi:hypothetical protein
MARRVNFLERASQRVPIRLSAVNGLMLGRFNPTIAHSKTFVFFLVITFQYSTFPVTARAGQPEPQTTLQSRGV